MTSKIRNDIMIPESTLRGMDKGAVKGAVEGAADGLISGMIMGGISTAGTTIANGHGTFCFVAGTTVLTTLGKKAIETIQVGDAVPCVDHITGEATEKKVVSTSVNKVNRLTELDIDGEIIQCTETHPFQVKDKGWIDACELVPGDVVYTKDWNTATVNSVKLLELDEPVEVFNFEVEDYHTYFIGDTLVLVHNGGCGDFKKINPKEFETKNNLPQGTYHEVIKPKIKATVKPNYKIGSNPDIMLNKSGDIAYQSVVNKVPLQKTGLNIYDILKKMKG